MRLIVLVSALAVSAAFRPGVPPQCFDQFNCIFHRSQLGAKGYSWDLINLCMPAGQEYQTYSAGQAPGTFPKVIFNICGSVSQAVAPCKDKTTTDCDNGQIMPMPHSHGVVIQYINDPAHDQLYNCADLDTCDQDTNPNCVIGSLNYDATRDGINPYTNLAINHNVGRETRCAQNPARYYCLVKGVKCTDAVEVLASYDGVDADSQNWATSGSPPAFELNDESDPNSGIILHYPSAKGYVSDPFSSTGCPLDPTTGLAAERSVQMSIACDQGVSGFVAYNYTEISPCTYVIYGASKAACGTPGNTFDANALSASDIPISKTSVRNWWFTVLGASLVVVLYVLYNFLDNRGYLDSIKARMPSWMQWPAFLGGSGGGSSGGGYSSSYKSVGSPAPVSSGSAYGSA